MSVSGHPAHDGAGTVRAGATRLPTLQERALHATRTDMHLADEVPAESSGPRRARRPWTPDRRAPAATTGSPRVTGSGVDNDAADRRSAARPPSLAPPSSLTCSTSGRAARLPHLRRARRWSARGGASRCSRALDVRTGTLLACGKPVIKAVRKGSVGRSRSPPERAPRKPQHAHNTLRHRRPTAPNRRAFRSSRHKIWHI